MKEIDYLAEAAILSISSFLFTEKEVVSFLDAPRISSARQLAIGFLLLYDAFVAPIAIFLNATSILLDGATSTAFGTAMPPYLSLVTSSLGAAFSIAFTSICTGFCLVLF